VRIAVLRGMTPCSLVDGYQCFAKNSCVASQKTVILTVADIITETCRKEAGYWICMNSSGSGYGLVARCCERCNQ
jgi:hypothetical protein